MATFSKVGTATAPSNESAQRVKTYQSDMGVSQAYQVRLEVRGDKQLLATGGRIFPIIASLPERYNIEFSSSWSSPFAKSDMSSLAGAIGGSKYGAMAAAIANGALNVAGISTRLKSQSVQVWDSTSSMSFSIQMIFNALSNSATDVRDKHRALLKLCAPSENAVGVLTQPGPTIASATSAALGFSGDSRKISLYIGRYIVLDNVIITGVSSDVSTLCDINGIPINMTINLQVQSFFSCFTSEDIDKMFNVL